MEVIEDPILIELLNQQAIPHLQGLYKGLRKPENYEFPYIKNWVKQQSQYIGSVYIKATYSNNPTNWQKITVSKGGISG